MALYRLEFLVSNDVDITSGTKTVTINDSVDVSSVVPGTAIFINNQVVEALSGQNVSPTQATIELRYNWPFATVTAGRLVAFNTFEGLNTAISRLNDVINSVPDFTGATNQGFLYNDGSNTYTIKSSTVLGESLLNSASASAARALLELLPASTSEAQDGTDDSRYMTPLKTRESISKSSLTFEAPSNVSVFFIAIGVSASSVRAFISINSNSRPTSLSVSGTFSLNTLIGGSTGNDNISQIDYISSISNGRVAVVEISSLSNITPGESYRVQSESTASRMEFN